MRRAHGSTGERLKEEEDGIGACAYARVPRASIARRRSAGMTRADGTEADGRTCVARYSRRWARSRPTRTSSSPCIGRRPALGSHQRVPKGATSLPGLSLKSTRVPTSVPASAAVALESPWLAAGGARSRDVVLVASLALSCSPRCPRGSRSLRRRTPRRAGRASRGRRAGRSPDDCPRCARACRRSWGSAPCRPCPR